MSAVPTGLHPVEPHNGVSLGETDGRGLLGATVDTARRADIHQRVYFELYSALFNLFILSVLLLEKRAWQEYPCMLSFFFVEVARIVLPRCYYMSL